MTAPLDRAALERVLARAAELQAQAGSADADGAMSDDQIVDLGKEVGLAPDTLRQALAEERGRVVVPQARGVTGGWFGAATISATRVVPGTPASVLAQIDDALGGDLRFDVSRRFVERMQWMPRRGFLDTMKTQLGPVTEGGNLRLCDEVAASVGTVAAQRTHVRLDATIAELRGRARTTTLGLAMLVFAPWAAVVIVGVTTALVAVPAVAVLTGLVAVAEREWYRKKAMQVGTALEQLLDRLEFGPTKRPRGIIDKLLG